MNEEQLLKLQDELMKEIDKETELETHIVESAELIAKELLAKKRTRAEIDGSNFSLISNIYFDEKAKVRKTCIIAVDELKFKIACGKYQPFLIEAEFDEDYSEEENLAMVIESFIRHKTGLIKPEEIENN